MISEEAAIATRQTRGYAICLVGVVLWSSAAVFIRHLTETYTMPALVLAFWRDLIVAATLLAVLALIRPALIRVARQHLSFLIAYALLLSLFNSLWTVSVALNGAAVSTVLVYSSPAFTAVLGWRLFGERLNALKALAVTLSMLGCVFISGAYDPHAWSVNALGVITGLVSGFAFAAYSLMGKSASRRGINPWSVMLYTFGLAAPYILIYNLLNRFLPAGVASMQLLWLGGALSGWVNLVLLALVPTIGGYGLYMVSLNYLPASVANLLATLEPVMTAILAYVLLAERFSAPQLLGGVLIFSAVIVLRISER